ncbi:MAG: DUF3991 and toprim domain-containing protein [Defluviitaleaceae bacterium]|nr:DUF3991 and toprim domain-containing protein [Defluviitaleaceae bacterium]
MGRVTKEQLARARETKVLDYILQYEADKFHRVGSGYRSKAHPSLAVNAKGFYWHSHEKGGTTALDYLTNICGYGLVDAVCNILNEKPQERGNIIKSPKQNTTNNTPAPPVQKALSLPLRYKNNNRVIAYLQSRGIDRELIMNCIEQGTLYESQPYHNAVFTGKDENGKTRYVALRGTISNFKQDAEGSDKSYGFTLLPSNPNTREVVVFEAPINALSHQTLCKQGFLPPFEGWRLSLGCTSTKALERFLAHHPEVNHCIIATDNDDAGDHAAIRIEALPKITTTRIIPTTGDWNDMLQDLQKSERTKNKDMCGYINMR